MEKFNINHNSEHIGSNITSITIKGNNIKINGKLYNTNDIAEKHISIVITGNCNNIDVDCCDTIQVQGNIAGDVGCVNVDKMHIDRIDGNVTITNGSINAMQINGKCKVINGDSNSLEL